MLKIKLLKNFNGTIDLHFHLTSSNKVKRRRSVLIVLFLSRYESATPQGKFPEVIKMSLNVININSKTSNQYSPCQLFLKN